MRDDRTEGEFVETTVGRIIFDSVVPDELPFPNHIMDKKALKEQVNLCYHSLDKERTADFADQIKHLGFTYATRSGITIAVDELGSPAQKGAILEDAELRVQENPRPIRDGPHDRE